MLGPGLPRAKPGNINIGVLYSLSSKGQPVILNATQGPALAMVGEPRRVPDEDVLLHLTAFSCCVGFAKQTASSGTDVLLEPVLC